MSISIRDVVPFTQARAHLSELAEQAKAGAEKIIPKNGESYVALIDADRLDSYHRLERERIHLLQPRGRRRDRPASATPGRYKEDRRTPPYRCRQGREEARLRIAIGSN